MVKSPKEEYIEFIAEIQKIKGLDELSSKVIGILYVEPKDLSLDELAKRSGYSLSSISTLMKFMENAGLVRRLKKPKSKKVYFYMEKDLAGKFAEILRDRYKKIISLSKKRLPEIIDKYKKLKNSKEELKIAENNYKQMLVLENVMKKFIDMLEEANKKLKRSK